VPRTRSPARLVIALSVAALLAVFLIYTSLAGDAMATLRPSQLRGHQGDVSLSGKVIGKPTGDPQAGGLRFRLRDVKGKASVPVLYHGAVPDLFRSGRDVSVTGRLRNGVFIGDRDSLVTKCPSKYTPKR
jgi:cytochrome c-type biogenesis protein CcmE